MVPVGGAIIAAFDTNSLKRVSQLYPGRASSSQTLDVLITLLSMGSHTYKELLKERKECFAYLKESLAKLATQFNERVIEVASNNISIGFSLKRFDGGSDDKELTQIGSMLYIRNVSGVR
jgi:O-phospho-L-seryl-tRNASec:L-selenocysteinyl-tRNA synthase